MVVKWSIMPVIDQGPFLGFACSLHTTFHGSQTQHATQKVARVKEPRKKIKERGSKQN